MTDSRPIPLANGNGTTILDIIKRGSDQKAGPEGCWPWLLGIDADGYGRCTIQRRNLLAHRVSYVSANGQIPDGMTLDHLCRNRGCVNPGHLEPVTALVNKQRMRITRCKHGHEMTEDNLYHWRTPSGRIDRSCRACVLGRPKATPHTNT